MATTEELSAKLRRAQIIAVSATIIAAASMIAAAYALNRLESLNDQVMQLAADASDHEDRLDQLESAKDDLDSRLDDVESKLHM